MSKTQHLGRTATSVRTENGTTKVRYHATDVVTFDAKRVTLNSNGWRTATTKLRMNQAANQYGLGFIVTQHKFVWYVIRRGYDRGWDFDHSIPYYDGMTFDRA